MFFYNLSMTLTYLCYDNVLFLKMYLLEINYGQLHVCRVIRVDESITSNFTFKLMKDDDTVESC